MLDIEFVNRLACKYFSISTEYIKFIAAARREPEKYVPSFVKVVVRYPSIKIFNDLILIKPICIGKIRTDNGRNESVLCFYNQYSSGIFDCGINIDLYVKSTLFDINLLATSFVNIPNIIIVDNDEYLLINTRGAAYSDNISNIYSNISELINKDIPDFINPGIHCIMCSNYSKCSRS